MFSWFPGGAGFLSNYAAYFLGCPQLLLGPIASQSFSWIFWGSTSSSNPIPFPDFPMLDSIALCHHTGFYCSSKSSCVIWFPLCKLLAKEISPTPSSDNPAIWLDVSQGDFSCQFGGDWSLNPLGKDAWSLVETVNVTIS